MALELMYSVRRKTDGGEGAGKMEKSHEKLC